MLQFCTFCKIVSGEFPSNTIYQDEHTFAFIDIRPINLGHTLLVSKDHYENIFDVPDTVLSHLGKTLKTISTAVKVATGAEGMNIGMNNERAAGQIINHIHFHIIPRFSGDGLQPWPGKLYSEGELKEIAEKIRESF